MQKNVDILNTMDNVPVLVVAVLLCCLAAAAVAVVAAKMPQARVPTPTPGPGITLSGGLGSQTWVIVGGGLTAVSCIRRLPSSMRSIITLREASNRLGGRTTSTTQAVTPVSTETSPWEFGAWAYRPFAHAGAAALLDELGVASVSINIVTPSTFIWTSSRGRVPYGTLLDAGDTTAATSAQAVDQQAIWFAHTGIRPLDVPRADTAVLLNLDTPKTALLPVGFGWQDVVLRGIGTVPVLYGRLLSRVDVVSMEGKQSRTRVKLTYASGSTEVVDGVVLTLPPPAMLAITNLPRSVSAAIQQAFTTASMGVLYATWASMDVWWSKLGFFTGMAAAPDVPIGRVCVTSTNALRCSMSGAADVQFWNDMFIQHGERATATAVAAQLSKMFSATVPVPANVVVKGWMQALSLWTTGTDRATVRAVLERPWGADVPIWWACSDMSDEPGWAEGAVTQGASAARGVAEFICTTTVQSHVAPV